MDISMLNDLVSNLGFPIVMVAYFIWDKTKTTNNLVEAINNNNVILSRLLEKLDSVELLDSSEKAV